MKNKITFVGANKVFLTFTVLYLAFQFVLSAFILIYGQDIINNNLLKILLVNQYIIILIPVLLYVYINKLNIREVFRLNNPGIMPLVLIILMAPFAYMSAAMLNTLVVYLVQFLGDVPSQGIPVPENIRDLAFSIFVIAVSPAICEELLHRGILLKAYENRGTLRALFLTSVLFGVFHFEITNFIGPVFLGFLIGYYVIRTNSIFTGMLAHFMNNAIAVSLQYFYRKEIVHDTYVKISLEELISSVYSGMSALAVLVALFILFRYATRKKYVYKPAIASIKNDIISTVTHWPVIIILVVYSFVVGLSLVSIYYTNIT